MNKEQLETDIAALELLVNDTASKSKDFTAQLEQAKKDLANVNKPELTPMQFDNLYEAVESGVSGYDFSDSDNFDYEFDINYDNKIELNNLDITNSQDLVEAIVEELTKLFTEAECPEELDTTEPDNHA